MKKFYYLISIIILTIIPAEARFNYQTDFTAKDFQSRRDAIYEAIGNNIAIIQGAGEVQGFIKFRQSNSFYYLSGLESASAYMLLDGKAKETTLYLPHRDFERERGEGPVLSYEDKELIKKTTGADYVRPIEKLASDFMNYTWGPLVPALYTPHQPEETYLQSRDEISVGFGRRMADPFDGRPSKAGHFINLMKTRFPQFEIRDLSPTLDVQRLIKDEKEIGLIRKASELAGLGIMEAIRSTKPNVMEYQLEAAANFVFKNNGARGFSYNAIVAGGKNAWIGHYSANSDPVKKGDLILMDLAPDYHYYTSDVTRMWPVNGKYSDVQRNLYGYIIEFHKAFMRHLRPGLTPSQVFEETRKDMQKVFDSMSFSKEIYRKACEEALSFKGAIQHTVGMSVHDVNDVWGQPLKEGMVFALDPMIWVPDEKLYIRMENVVVITKDGVENLSANLPIEMDDIEALYQEEGIVQKRPATIQ